jgi:uncharacterized protein (DUF1330 family)
VTIKDHRAHRCIVVIVVNRRQGRRQTEINAVRRSDVAAYVIAMVDVKDPVRYEDYRRMVLPTITAFGGRFIARGGRTEALEGQLPAGRMVIVEFPSLDKAKEWWSSPQYAEARAIRQATSDGTLIVVEGV